MGMAGRDGKDLLRNDIKKLKATPSLKRQHIGNGIIFLFILYQLNTITFPMAFSMKTNNISTITSRNDERKKKTTS